jgi:chemotaxis regulatin CheY-phosphate phosphatase CheZ
MTNSAQPSAELPFQPSTLLRAYSEIMGILERLRESRDVLEQAAKDRLTQMGDKLKEVSSATETAATDIMNGVDRVVGMIGDLDTLAEQPDGAARATEVRAAMRDELFGLMIHLQFQDITTQQLAYAGSIITEMEHRLSEIVGLFDPNAIDGIARQPVSTEPEGPVTFDPNATNTDATSRQTLADEIFLIKR